MKIAALVLFAFGCATTATADPAPAPAPPPTPAPAPRHPPAKGCVAKGTPVLEIEHKADAKAKLATSTFKLYESGAWTLDSKDPEGKAGEPKRGCFSADDKKALDADLKVEWKVTTAQIHCMAYSPAFTDYTVNGKLVYTARICSGKTLDEASQKALTDIEAHVKAATDAS
jgi:hypothetical protein